MTEDISLTSQDPTIFVICDNCNRITNDGTYGNYYGASFTKQQWKRGEVCPNCKGELRVLRRIKGGK